MIFSQYLYKENALFKVVLNTYFLIQDMEMNFQSKHNTGDGRLMADGD